ncbi:hypothetical protein QZH41_003332 [Actinostola sp. cb2023]|nr:hypothetical protein QZH41_003332 [Actinostola sp. cb2023]
MMWKVVSAKVSYLSSKFQKANSDFVRKVFGITGTMARWLRCIRRLNSVEGLTMALGKLWIDNEFDKDIVPLLEINSDDHYLLNVMNMSDWYRRFQITKIARPVDNSEWLLGPQIVNAFYKMSRNEIHLKHMGFFECRS